MREILDLLTPSSRLEYIGIKGFNDYRETMVMHKETVAVAIGVYEAVKAKAFYAQQELLANMVRDFDIWLLRPIQTRLTYPFCVRWMLEDMFDREKRSGKKADWFLWMDDDIIPPENGLHILRANADPITRPHVAAIAYSRNAPYFPSAVIDGKAWEDHPSSGTFAVDHVGMSMCLVHRSVFEKIPEPWFGIDIPVEGNNGYGPDRFFSKKLRQYGIRPHVCFDVECGHLMDGLAIDARVRLSLMRQSDIVETNNGLPDTDVR